MNQVDPNQDEHYHHHRGGDDDGGKWERLHDVMEIVCSGGGDDTEMEVVGGGESDDFNDTIIDELAERAREVIADGMGKMNHKNSKNNNKRMIDSNEYQFLEDCFNSCEEYLKKEDDNKEFELIQSFIVSEQTLGRQRRKLARKIEANEEKRLASEILQLKGYRSQVTKSNSHDELQRKIADSERSYFNKKMVIVKSAQTANAECRLQFTRVREFFDELHKSRCEALKRQYKRSLKLQAISHKLRNTDTRVMALEKQIINRLYHKKKTDLNELHMTQNVEEAIYLESMIELLGKVQTGKEIAARELFELHVQYLKETRDNNMRRYDELTQLRTKATTDMAAIIAHYTDEGDENKEEEELIREKVDSIERKKDYYNSAIPIMSVSQLYDTVLWSVATTQLATTEGSSTIYSSSDFGSEDEYNGPGGVDDCDDDEGINDNMNDEKSEKDLLDLDDLDNDNNIGVQKDDELHHGSVVDVDGMIICDTASTQGGSTCCGNSVVSGGGINGGGSMNGDDDKSRLSLLGRMHAKQLSKEFRALEKELLKKHDSEIKIERKKYRAKVKILRRKHQKIIDGLLQKCLYERHNLREAISYRMRTMEKNMEDSTRTLRKTIENDIKVMQDALRAEDRRLKETEKNSFIKAQELISSQVFHEVRNALSSMISMSEITSSLRNDPSLSPTDLVRSVDDMLDQIKEVVQYSLNMLNNVLDVSKIKSGSFAVDKKSFDIQELVAGATRMQLAKARHLKMSFVPYNNNNGMPCIANTDHDLVIRIVTNFISNAIKFTNSGAIQPFVWPIDDMFGTHNNNNSTNYISSNSSVASNDTMENNNDFTTAAFREPDKQFTTTVRLLESQDSQLSGNSDDENENNNKEFHEEDPVTQSTNGDEQQQQQQQQHPTQITVKGKKTKLFAIGVADTGRGLSKEKLRSSEVSLTSSDSDSMVSCVRNSGFGLHLAHLLAKALKSKLHLTSLERCQHLLNDDMINAMEEYHSGNDTNELDLDGTESVGGRSTRTISGPGRGTVIYITLPVTVYDDANPDNNEDRVSTKLNRNHSLNEIPVISDCDERTDPRSTNCHDQNYYIFSPKPSPSSSNGTFRILVADDVKMLRKGIMHSLTKLFPVPISVCTACTAEEVLRMTSAEPFDMVICDNQFNHEDATIIPRLSKEEKNSGRPRLIYDSTTASSADFIKRMKEYFDNERFSFKDGDGELCGFEALQKLSGRNNNSKFPTPVLILLSGHKWEKPPSPGVIVVQKPLNYSGFIPLLESHAKDLVETGYCIETSDDNGPTTKVVNQHGSQIFVAKER